jgi:predicted dehydrogenase
MPVTVAIVGAGFVAELHAHAYRQIGHMEVEVVAVAATSLESAGPFARRHGIPDAYDDYRRILDRADVDLVDVCTPNVTHEPLVVAAARAGKHVAVEKPLTGYFGGEGAANPVGTTPRPLMLAGALASADRMLQAAQEAGVRLMYAENWIYCPAIRRVAELAEATGGAILQIRGEESHSGSHAITSKRWATAGGGALIRLAPHPLGAALYLKEQEGLRRDGRPIRPVAVTAEVADLTRMAAFQAEEKHWLVDGWHDVENWSTLIVAFADGSRAVIGASDIALGGIETSFEVFLSNGRIQCDMSHSDLLRAFVPDAAIWGDTYLMEKVDHKGGWSFPSVDEHWMLGYPQEMRDFVEAVAHDRPPRSTGALGREVVRVIYAGYRAAQEGRRIELDDGL